MIKAIYVVIGVLFLCTSDILAQDVMYKMDGEQIEVKVLEVSPTEIKYKLTSNVDGPTYVLPKKEIYMLEYANGSKEVFGAKSVAGENHAANISNKDTSQTRSQDEILYRRQKGGGIAGVIIGSVMVVISGAFTVAETNNYLKATKEDRVIAKPVVAGLFTGIGIISLSAGIDALVKASVTKTRLDRQGSAFHVDPKIFNATSYRGSFVEQNSAFGISFTYRF